MTLLGYLFALSCLRDVVLGDWLGLAVDVALAVFCLEHASTRRGR